jgi:hypothetical protein
MDTRTPILILFGTLLAALALSVLGLAADNASYYHSHQNGDVDVHYIRWNSTAEAQYSYWVKLDYAPSNFTLSKEYAEIATAVICAVIGTIIAVGAWFARSQKTSQTGPKTRRPSFLPIALGLSILAFCLSLAVTVYTYHPAMKWSINFKNSIPLPPQVSNPDQEPPTRYQSPFAYTPEVWNCLLSPYVVSAQNGRMQSLCQEAKAAKYLMVPVFIVSAVLAGSLGFMVWKAKKAGANGEVEMEAGGKEVDEISVETASVDAKD